MSVGDTRPQRPLLGQYALITGSSSGIGLETAAGLAEDGATVVLGCRNLTKAQDVAEELRARCPDAQLVIDAEPLDLAHPESIRAYAEAYQKSGRPLHILVNNAGANYKNAWKTADGVPGLVQTNYLGPYLLTRLLEGTLKASKPARVINVTSVTHRYANFTTPSDLLTRLNIGVNSAYPCSKLANVLFTYELQKRWGDSGVQAAAVDPGGVRTAIWKREANRLITTVVNQLYAPERDGAQAVLHACRCAMDPRKGGPNSNGRPRKPTFSTPCRHYARGLFATWPVTHFQGGYPSGFVESVRAYAWATRTALFSMLDWPIRSLSKGRLASSTSLVPSSPMSYNARLAADLWDLSADIAKIER